VCSSVVERHSDKMEVVGSIPTTPTKIERPMDKYSTYQEGVSGAQLREIRAHSLTEKRLICNEESEGSIPSGSKKSHPLTPNLIKSYHL
jgi:hypothetical protein